MGQVIGSIGDDLELKIWEENPSQPKQSGRRFTCAYRQSSGNGVVYSSLDFTNIRHETYLALVTRDGLLSLMEPVDAEKFDDWKELDQILVCGEFIGRNIETQFRVAFQKTPRPNHGAIQAGVDKKALTLAVTALDRVYIYRIQKTGHSGDGQYKIQAPVAELTGSDGLVRDVAWSSSFYLPYDWIATAAADGYVRIYELTTPADNESRSQDILTSGEPASRASLRLASGIGAGLAGPAIAPSFMSVRHEWKLLTKLKHEGVWRVVWMPNGKYPGHT
jgi:nucleoporin SEH1